MSVAAMQARKFYEQVSREKVVFTFTENEEYLVFPIQGKEVVPFWSSRSRLESIQKNHEKYKKFKISEEPFKEFATKTIDLLEEEGISVGINWSGKRLTGYDLSVPELRRNLLYWQEKNEDHG